jgi:hypothetical protein
MATSVKHAVPEEGATIPRVVPTFPARLLILLIVALASCSGSPKVVIPLAPYAPPPPGCPNSTAPSDTTQLRACLDSLRFDTLGAVGDEQRLLVHDTLPGPVCHGDSTHSCRYGPLARIEPEIKAHQRDTLELNEGRIIARLFLRQGESEPYPKLGLVQTDTTYWWVRRTSGTTGVAKYIRISGDTVVASPEQPITIELHPPGTFHQALARFIWSDTDEKTWGSCGLGCCR